MASMDSTFGMLFDSVIVGAALYGAGCLQGYLYFRKYSTKDPWILKSLVAFVLVCDTFQVGILTACVYQYLVSNFANPNILGELLNTLIIEIFFSDTIGLAVQMFYCWRVWRLSDGNFFIVVPLVIVSWAAFASLVVYSCLALKITTYAELASLKNLSMSCNVLAAAADILISLAMIVLLQRSKTNYKKTNSMLNRLIIFTFNTGIPVSICALWACIAINAWPSTFIYIFFFLLQGRFYTNSLLVTLNSREYIKRGAQSNVTDATYSMNSYDGSRTNSQIPQFNVPSKGLRDSQNSHFEDPEGSLAIRIDTTRHTDLQFANMAKAV
jgi:hypothetical protein